MRLNPQHTSKQNPALGRNNVRSAITKPTRNHKLLAGRNVTTKIINANSVTLARLFNCILTKITVITQNKITGMNLISEKCSNNDMQPIDQSKHNH